MLELRISACITTVRAHASSAIPSYFSLIEADADRSGVTLSSR